MQRTIKSHTPIRRERGLACKAERHSAASSAASIAMAALPPCFDVDFAIVVVVVVSAVVSQLYFRLIVVKTWRCIRLYECSCHRRNAKQHNATLPYYASFLRWRVCKYICTYMYVQCVSSYCIRAKVAALR